MKQIIIILCTLTLLSACQSAGRYHQKVDSKPQFDYGNIDLSDAQPQFEPYRSVNSRPYTVLGKHYTPLLNGKGFVQTGKASWYGQKFHGHTTSNGEVYDMFQMTAAHKTLPLPSYVRVTNIDNNKVVILRVNDRGPFHPGRVIDLSYAAAKKLDVLKTGTANVRLEVIHIDQEGMKTVGLGPTVAPDVPYSIAKTDAPIKSTLKAVDGLTTTQIALSEQEAPTNLTEQLFIQIAAVSEQANAAQLTDTLAQMYQINVNAPLINDLYRVRLGPIKSERKAKTLIQSLKENGFQSAFQVLVPAE